MMTTGDLEQITIAVLNALASRSPPYLIGTQLFCQETNVTFSSAGLVTIIPGNANRVCLAMSSGAPSQFSFSLNPGLGQTKGLTTTATNGITYLNINDHGPLVQQQLYVYSGSSGGNFCYMETLWKPDGEQQ